MTGEHEDNDIPEDDWAAAMAEQASDTLTDNDTADDTAGGGNDDPWAEAMAEQESTSTATPTEPSEPNSTIASTGDPSLFKPLTGDGHASESRDLDMIMEIPVTLSVELGQTRLTIRELLDLAKGSIVELEGFAGEPMDILVNGYLIAQGEVVVVDDKYGIRINEIVNRAERIHKLNR